MDEGRVVDEVCVDFQPNLACLDEGGEVQGDAEAP